MINALLYPVVFIILALIWHNMRSGILNGKTWTALLRTYKTMETPTSLSSTYLDIVWFYFDDRYGKRVYKFYETSEGLLITPNRVFFIKENVLIPWHAIQPNELHQRGIGTTQGLGIANTIGVKMDISRADFIQYIRPQIGT